MRRIIKSHCIYEFKVKVAAGTVNLKDIWKEIKKATDNGICEKRIRDGVLSFRAIEYEDTVNTLADLVSKPSNSVFLVEYKNLSDELWAREAYLFYPECVIQCVAPLSENSSYCLLNSLMPKTERREQNVGSC